LLIFKVSKESIFTAVFSSIKLVEIVDERVHLSFGLLKSKNIIVPKLLGGREFWLPPAGVKTNK